MNSEVKWDRFMVPILSLNPGDFNLLEVDKPILMPLEKTTNFLVTSADVLHSFAIPRFGIKVDCVPGRINQTFVQPIRLGVYYGQCSEICGANHRFMPISVEVHHE
jgi:cytochrome c oxidase subunit 2